MPKLSPTTKRILITSITGILLIGTSLVAIFWARGFKFSPQTGISRTGLIVATSIPEGAKIFLDDKLISATNTTISFLEPKNYKVKITKDGFTTWEKDVQVNADLISEVSALLFPLAPELKPLTVSGALQPQISPDSQKLTYTAPGFDRGGIWLQDLTEKPLNFNRGPKLIVRNTKDFDFTNSRIVWSPSSDQIIAQIKSDTSTKYFLFDVSRTDNPLTPVTEVQATDKLAEWQESIRLTQTNNISLLPQSVRDAAAQSSNFDEDQINPTPTTAPKTKTLTKPADATASAAAITLNYNPFNLKFSPDADKVLYRTQNNDNFTYRVYDTKLKKETIAADLPSSIVVNWFPDSNHLILVSDNNISVVEIDGSNKQVVFTGDFKTIKTAIPWPDGSRIIIETNFNTDSPANSNLYTIVLH